VWLGTRIRMRSAGRNSIRPPRLELNYASIPNSGPGLKFDVGNVVFAQEQLTGSWSVRSTRLVYQYPYEKPEMNLLECLKKSVMNFPRVVKKSEMNFPRVLKKIRDKFLSSASNNPR
jgi:hypothetical protein